jgi:hypothetical protein
VSDYAPHAFGDLIAHVSSNIGDITVVYDRQFLVESTTANELSPELVAQLQSALERQKRNSA